MDSGRKKYVWFVALVAGVIVLGVVFKTIGELLRIANSGWIPWLGRYIFGAAVLFLVMKILAKRRS